MDGNLTKLVLGHLMSGKSITSFQAFTEYGATRLSAIIFNLREKGLDIRDTWVYATNRYGNVVKFKSYYLVKGKK